MDSPLCKYRRRRLQRIATDEARPDLPVRAYADIMLQQALHKQKEYLLKKIAKKKEEEEEEEEEEEPPAQAGPKRTNRSQHADRSTKKTKTGSDWEALFRWDETPTPGRMVDSDAMPAGLTWDATPKLSGLAG